MTDPNIELYTNIIDSYTRDNQRLESQYGKGVRPSWVGEEITINEDRIERYTKALAELMAKQA